MRLTNTDRDAFIQSVMDDVPKIDYAGWPKDQKKEEVAS